MALAIIGSAAVVAIGLMTPNDLSSKENLQEYQLRMKQLYGLEKFAFIDENGLIYTSRGTRTDIDQYRFDYESITGPEVSLKGEDGDISYKRKRYKSAN